MSQAEELLDDIVSVDETDAGYKPIVLEDTETGTNYELTVENGRLTMSKTSESGNSSIIIPAITDHIVIGIDRYIIIPDALKKIAVQHDHNIETVTFDCPRYWDEHDMSKMKIYINYLRPDDTKGSDLAKNVVVDGVDPDIMHFDWTITGHMTEFNGPITFLVCVQKVGSDGTTSNHWNSELSIGEMYVSPGLECEETIVSIYPGIITSLLTRMDEAEENLLTWMRETDTNLANWKTSTYKSLDDRMKVAESNTTSEAILRRINECLDSNATTQQVIYDSVTEYLAENTALSEEINKQVAAYLDENLEEATKNMLNLTSLETFEKSAVITPTVEGNVMIGSIYGDSYQAANPSPDSPQEIENVGVYDEASGKYTVEVKCTDEENSEESVIILHLDEPLRKGDIICQKDGVWGVERYRAVIASYNGETIDTEYMSTTGGLDTGTTVEYTLAEPTFTPFEDQTPFYNLMAFDTVTNVSIIDGSENTIPVATMRFPKYTDGGILLTDYAERKKKEIAVANEAKTVADEVKTVANEAKTVANEAKTVANEAKTVANEAKTVANNIIFNNAGAHNAFYRGKYLGTAVTDTQYSAISAGTFDDLYIGDYWTIDGVNWRIAAFDYYLNSGDTNCTTHHAVIVPDTVLYNHVMNSSKSTSGGYVDSDMYKNGLTQAITIINDAFTGHVLNHREFFVNAVSNGKPSAGAWYDSEVDLMSEEMVYGGAIIRPAHDGDSTVITNYRAGKSQLPLFAHEPSRANIEVRWWLRDPVSNERFANISQYGSAAQDYANTTYGVRPCFCIH